MTEIILRKPDSKVDVRAEIFRMLNVSIIETSNESDLEDAYNFLLEKFNESNRLSKEQVFDLLKEAIKKFVPKKLQDNVFAEDFAFKLGGKVIDWLSDMVDEPASELRVRIEREGRERIWVNFCDLLSEKLSTRSEKENNGKVDSETVLTELRINPSELVGTDQPDITEHAEVNASPEFSEADLGIDEKELKRNIIKVAIREYYKAAMEDFIASKLKLKPDQDPKKLKILFTKLWNSGNRTEAIQHIKQALKEKYELNYD